MRKVFFERSAWLIFAGLNRSRNDPLRTAYGGSSELLAADRYGYRKACRGTLSWEVLPLGCFSTRAGRTENRF